MIGKCPVSEDLNVIFILKRFRGGPVEAFLGGGLVWDSNVFSKSVTYRPTLSKFKGGAVKKNTSIWKCVFQVITR